MPVAYDVLNRNGKFVTPWVLDPDYMLTCAADYITDTCTGTSMGTSPAPTAAAVAGARGPWKPVGGGVF